MNIEDYRATPISPQAKPRELNRKLKDGERYTAGDILACVHNYLPYRIKLEDLGISQKRTPHDDPMGPDGNARFARQERLREFMSNITPDMLTDTKDGHARYEYNSDGDWSICTFWIYLKDPKLISVLKLAFG